jgi:transposase-like protein
VRGGEDIPHAALLLLQRRSHRHHALDLLKRDEDIIEMGPDRCENVHRLTRERERRMQRFTSPGHTQRFLSAYGPIAQHFRPRRHLLSAFAYRQEMRHRFQVWREITDTDMAA